MWDWLSDLGSGIGDIFSGIGGGVMDAASGIGRFASSLAPVFGLGSQVARMVEPDSPQAQAAPPPAQGYDPSTGAQPGPAQPQGRGLMGNVADILGVALPVAATGFGVKNAVDANAYAKEQQDYLKQMQQLQMERSESGRPIREAGSAQYLAGTQALQGGALPAAMEAQITNWKTGAQQKIRDYLARAGISDSSMALQYDAWLGTQEQAMRADLARQLQAGGVAGYNAGAYNPGDAMFAQIASGQGASTADLVGQAQKAIQALSAMATPRQPGAPAPGSYGAPGINEGTPFWGESDTNPEASPGAPTSQEVFAQQRAAERDPSLPLYSEGSGIGYADYPAGYDYSAVTPDYRAVAAGMGQGGLDDILEQIYSLE